MTCRDLVCFEFSADNKNIINTGADSLFCRAISVSCLPRIHACAIKSKQSEPRQPQQVIYYTFFFFYKQPSC